MIQHTQDRSNSKNTSCQEKFALNYKIVSAKHQSVVLFIIYSLKHRDTFQIVPELTPLLGGQLGIGQPTAAATEAPAAGTDKSAATRICSLQFAELHLERNEPWP